MPLFYSFKHNIIAIMTYERGVYTLHAGPKNVYTYTSFAEFLESPWDYVGLWN